MQLSFTPLEVRRAFKKLGAESRDCPDDGLNGFVKVCRLAFFAKTDSPVFFHMRQLQAKVS